MGHYLSLTYTKSDPVGVRAPITVICLAVELPALFFLHT